MAGRQRRASVHVLGICSLLCCYLPRPYIRSIDEIILSSMIAPVMSAVAEIRSARKTAKRRGETEP